MRFDGFSKDAPKFLGKLGRNNTREWFQKNREAYDELLLEPAKQFVMAIANPLYDISPEINAEPRINAAIRRINRDTRFSADKRPYKDHFDFMFRQGGKSGASYFMRIAEKQVIIGAGLYAFDKSQITSYRDAVASRPGDSLVKSLASVKKSGYTVGDPHYKRVPSGYDAGHKRAELLRHNGLYAYRDLGLPKELFTRSFPAFCGRHFKKLSPLVDWISHNVP